VQGSRGEGWGVLKQRGGAQQGGGRKWQAAVQMKVHGKKKGGRNRAGGLGKKRNGCSTNDERCPGAGRGRGGAREEEGRGNDGQEVRWREVAWGGQPRNSSGDNGRHVGARGKATGAG
jgi:hypothetical protein